MDMYLNKIGDKWYALLPNRQYKEIPYHYLAEKIDWSVVYYKVYDNLLRGIITDENLRDWDLEKIFELTMDFCSV